MERIEFLLNNLFLFALVNSAVGLYNILCIGYINKRVENLEKQNEE